MDVLLRAELKKLAERLDETSLKPLSTGVGLGKLRPIDGSVQAQFTLNSLENPLSEFTDTGKVSLGSPNPHPFLVHSDARFSTDSPLVSQKHNKSIGSVLLLNMLAHAIDIAVVMFCCAIAFFMAYFLLTEPGSELQDFAKYLTSTSFILVILGLYAVFCIYALVFKLVAGSTLGCSILKVKKQIQPKKLAESPNGSKESGN